MNEKKAHFSDIKRDWVHINDTQQDKRYENVYQNIELGAVKALNKIDSNTFELACSQGYILQIAFWRSDICRIRYIRPFYKQHTVYALRPNLAQETLNIELKENDTFIELSSTQIRCQINKADASIHFFDYENNSILQQSAPYTERNSILKGTDQIKISFHNHTDDHYFGLGDKSGTLNLQHQQFENWNTDAFAYTAEKDPLYRSVPFYYGLHQEQCYGLFLNNTWRSHFDFNSQTDGHTHIWAEGGEMDFFFIHNTNLNKVAQAYHHLTGTAELPPLWLFGFHQCRWSYYPEQRVRELADGFREHRIPCDALYLDIDYMDDYKCFTWNNDYFPAPSQMISDLKEQGFHTVVMIDPGIKVDNDYAVFQSGLAADVFCKRASGELMVGPVWPSACVWPDFTNPSTQAWWGKLYEELYLEDGVSGFWNDMNEPAVFKVDRATFPDDVVHHNYGQSCDHRQAHNIYGQEMAKATTNGLKALQPNKRPFLLSRASFAGGQRHAAFWTGDNIASWEQLALANRQCQRMSISGFSLVGTDIGGFVDQPDGELFVRWLQLGIFHPLFRVHSMGNNADGSAEVDKNAVEAAADLNRFDREPWSFGAPFTSQARKAIEFRYQLLPYLYTAIQEHTEQQFPFLSSLSFVDHTDTEALKNENEFLCGTQLLISPVVIQGEEQHQAYLPKGRWLDYHTGKRLAGKQYISKTVDANTIPIYVKSGAVIPHYPVQQYTNELDIEQVRLQVYYGQHKHHSRFYKDHGDGYEHKQGEYRLHHFTTYASNNVFFIRQRIEGQITDKLQSFEIAIYGLGFSAATIVVDGVKVENINRQAPTTSFTVAADFKKIEVIG